MSTSIRGTPSSGGTSSPLERDSMLERTVRNGTKLALRRVEEQLVAEIAVCEQEVRHATEDLARLRAALRSLRKDGRSSRSGAPSEKATQAKQKLGRSKPERSGESAARTIRTFVREELKRAGRPLNRTEILNRLNSAGIEIDSKVPARRIGRVLWSSDEFQNVGDGYWFAGETIPMPGGDDD